MAFIDHHNSIIFISEVTYFVQLGYGAIHAERTIRNNYSAAKIGCFLQLIFQIFHAVVLIPEALRFAQTHAVYDACMIKRITDDGIFFIK